MDFDDFVKAQATPLYRSASGRSTACHLLWGDGVRYVGAAGSGDRRKVRARGRTGYIKKSGLGGQSLLEFYFIDVGQGDGVLIKTPSFRHLLIDGGFHRSLQDTGKNAADFVDWKFTRDYGEQTIHLDAMLATHNDADHYGGLSDLLDVKQSHELRADRVSVDAVYHAGLSWWRGRRRRSLGDWVSADSGQFWTRLLEGREHAKRVVGEEADPRLHGMWEDFIERVLGAKTKAGRPTPIQRISHATDYLPAFGPDVTDEPAIKVLGPVEYSIDGEPALRRFTANASQNTNGVSLLLRVDFGSTRVLLTGDLNKRSQHALLEDYEGDRLEFQCDVAKACHHGSADVSYDFLQAMCPAATVISSGDNEGHDHPRPSIIAASATTGHLELDTRRDEIVTPLVYSTELARSVDLATPTEVEELDKDRNVVHRIEGPALNRSRMSLRGARKKSVAFSHAMVVGNLIYGLVNVRTDGKTLLCATMDEKDQDWNINSFQSRF